MKKILVLVFIFSTVCYGQKKKKKVSIDNTTGQQNVINPGNAIKNASNTENQFSNAYFDDGQNISSRKSSNSGAILSGFVDDYTGEAVSFTKVTTWIDGSLLDDSKADGIIYRKKGSDFYRRNFKVLTPEIFGARGDGKTDDFNAFKSLFNFAKSQGNATIEASSGKTYKLTNAINLDFSKLGIIENQIQFNGNGCRFFLTAGSGGNGWWAFNIATDIEGIQNTRFNFNNINFYTDNINRPNGIKANGACFVTVENCKFTNLGEAVTFSFAGMSRINNCWAWGCAVGFSTYRCKDIYINECHAYGCDWGYRIEGINNVGTDGNVSVSNSAANACKKFNIKMKGIYTPFITNCAFELAPVNVSIESCNFGKISNIFSGPGRFEIIKGDGMLSNDYWNISNIDCQGITNINSLKFSNISNFKINQVDNNNNPQSASIIFSDCYLVNVVALIVQGSKPEVKNAVVVGNCSQFTWSNLNLDRPLFFDGNSRAGMQTLTASIINGNVVTKDGIFMKNENFDYIGTPGNIKHSVIDGIVVK